MAAVLDDAVTVYRRGLVSPTRRSRRLSDEIERWIASPDRGSLFAFENVCDHLDLNADCVRRHLRELRAALAAKQPACEPAPPSCCD
jgi:hypothetical protein